MKFFVKPFGKIIEEITIESSVGFDETIAKLREQQGEFFCESMPQTPFLLTCNNNGIIKMGKSYHSHLKAYLYRFYYVRAEVLEQDGKTIVKIYSVKNTLNFILGYAFIILTILYCIIFIAHLLRRKATGEWVNHRHITHSIFCIIGLIISFKNLEHSYKKSIVYIMRNNLIERIQKMKPEE